jgi:hypothetical protein
MWTRTPDLYHRYTHVTSFRLAVGFDTCRETVLVDSRSSWSDCDGENASFLSEVTCILEMGISGVQAEKEVESVPELPWRGV